MKRPDPSLRLTVWILERVLPADEVDAVVGDLLETREVERRSRLWLLGQALVFAVGAGVARMRDGIAQAGRTTSIRGILTGEGMGMETWIQDLKLAARSLLRRPSFSAVVVITMALGIGANTAIFSVIEGTLLRSLPFPEADRLVWMSDGYRDWGGYGSSMNLANILDLKEQATLVESMAAYQYRSANLAGEERPERAVGLAVGPDFLGVLGLRPTLGRDLTREDNTQGAASVAVLSHDLFLERFGGDAEVLGSTFTLDAHPYTVVGVTPPDFEFIGAPDFLVPIQYEGADVGRGGRAFNAIGRIAPGTTLEAAREELQTIFARLEAEYPESNENWQTWAQPLRDLWVGRAEGSLKLMGSAVFLVLLIACVNVANLLLARSESRRREVAVRVAMGAGRGRLLSVFVSEGLILGVAGGAVGLLLAYWGLPLLVSLYGSSLPGSEEIGLNGTVLVFASGLSLVTGFLVGILPAFRSDLRSVGDELKEGTRAVSTGGLRLRQGLVVVETALAVILVVGAGLMVNSFWRLMQVDVGLEEPDQVLVANLALSRGAYEEREDMVATFRDIVSSVEAVPGVLAAGLTNRLPLNGGYNITNVYVHNDFERVAHFVEIRYVSPSFFDAAGLEVVAGRGLEHADGEDASNIVVTEELARQLFGSAREAVDGSVSGGPNDDNPNRIVGVVSDVRDMGLDRPPPPGIYLARGTANPQSAGILLVRTSGDPLDVVPQIREAVTRLDPTLPVYNVRLLSDVILQTEGTRRFSMSLLALFAGLALLLGAVGIYGVMSYTVAERTREVGVRLALGADGGDVVRMVVAGGARLTALGLLLGIGSGVGLARLVGEQLPLYEVDATDPLTYVVVSVVLVGVALLASYLPARRAATVDPVEALRHE